MKSVIITLIGVLAFSTSFSQQYYYNALTFKSKDAEELKSKKIALVKRDFDSPIYAEYRKFTVENFKMFWDFNDVVEVYDDNSLGSINVSEYLFIMPEMILYENSGGLKSDGIWYRFKFMTFKSSSDLSSYLERTKVRIKDQLTGNKLPMTTFHFDHHTFSELINMFRYYNSEFHRVASGKKIKDGNVEHTKNAQELKK